MLRRWRKTRSWLVVWEVLALLWVAIAVNRFFRAEPVSYDVGVTPMDWETMMDFIRAASIAAMCAVVGLVPAAWYSLGPSRGVIEPAPTGSSGRTSPTAQSEQSLSA